MRSRIRWILPHTFEGGRCFTWVKDAKVFRRNVLI